MIDRVYAVLHRDKRLAYIGRTSRTIEARFAQHLRDAAAGRSHKTLAEALRHEPDAFSVIECEASETASEAHWMSVFTKEGYTLLNDASGNAKPPKERTKKVDVSTSVFVKTPEWRAKYDEFMTSMKATWVPAPCVGWARTENGKWAPI